MATYVLLSIDVSTYITYACVLPVLMMMTMPVSELINSLEVQGLIGVTGARKHWKYRRRRRPTTNFRLFSLSIFLLLFVIYFSLSLIYTVSPSYNTHNLSPSLIHSPIDTISLSFSHSHSIAWSFSLLYSNQIIFFLWNLLYVWSVIKNNLFCFFHLFSFRVNNRYSLAAVL